MRVFKGGRGDAQVPLHDQRQKWPGTQPSPPSISLRWNPEIRLDLSLLGAGTRRRYRPGSSDWNCGSGDLIIVNLRELDDPNPRLGATEPLMNHAIVPSGSWAEQFQWSPLVSSSAGGSIHFLPHAKPPSVVKTKSARSRGLVDVNSTRVVSFANPALVPRHPSLPFRTKLPANA